MRTAKLMFDSEALETLKQNIVTASDADPAAVTTGIRSAIGYLSTWAMDTERYAECTIVLTGSDEIVATYRQLDGVKLQYVLAAVWNGTAFGFHS